MDWRKYPWRREQDARSAKSLAPNNRCTPAAALAYCPPGDEMARGRLFWTVLRSLYGLFFLLTGAWIILSVTTGLVSPPPQPSARAAAFMQALSASGFMDPLLALSFVLGGGSLLVRRTAPLGLVILAPAVAVILLFHLFLSHQLLVGIVVAGILLALMWQERARLACLWSR